MRTIKSLKNRQSLQLSGGIEILETLSNTRGHGFLSLTDPDTRIEVLFVRLVLTIGVTNLRHNVILLLEYVVTDTSKVGILEVRIEVNLDHTIADGSQVLLLR